MRRFLVILSIALVVLAAVGFFTLRSVFTPERLRAMVVPRLSAALGRPVEIGEVRLGFPWVVRARDVRLPDPAGGAPLLQVESLELVPRLGALLQRRLAIRTVRIEGPVLHAVQHQDGTWNWKAPPRPVQPGTPATGSGGGGGQLDLSIQKIVITDGRLAIESAPMRLGLAAPLAAELSFEADRALRDVRIDGWLESDSLQSDSGLLRGLRGAKLRIEPKLRANLADSSASVEAVRLVVNEAAIDANGTARWNRGRQEILLATQAESIELAQLLDALPPGSTGAKGLRATGTVGLDLRIAVRPPVPPVVRGRIDLRDGTVQAAELPEKVSALAAQIELAGDSVRVQDLSARFGDAPVRVHGLLLYPTMPARTTYDLQLVAALDLARLGRVVKLPTGTTLAGHADADVRVRGRTARPDSMWIEGPVTLRNLDARTPALLQPVRGDARLVGTGPGLRIEAARFQAGTSDLALTGTVLPALPPRRPKLAVEGTSSRLDLAALLPAKAAAKVDSAAARAATTGTSGVTPLLPVLPPVDLQARLRAREVVLQAATLDNATLVLGGGPAGLDVEMLADAVRADQVVLRNARGTMRIVDQAARGTLRAGDAALRKIAATDLSGDLTIEGRNVRLDNVRGTAYAGALTGRAAIDFADMQKPLYDLDLTGDRIDANAFLSSVSPLRGIVSGKLGMQSGWKYTGGDPKSIVATLTGNGKATAVDGRINQLPVLNALSQWFKIPGIENLRYDKLSMQFALDDGRMQVRDLALNTGEADLGVAGSIGLDGALDLGLNVKLSPELSKRYTSGKSIGSLTSLFADPSGRLVFDFKVGGDYKAPRLQPDLQKTAASTGLSALTGSVLERVLGGKLPIPGIPGTTRPPAGATPDTATTTADAKRAAEDAARRAVEDASSKITDKLGGLLGGTKKKTPPAGTPPAPADTTRPR